MAERENSAPAKLDKEALKEWFMLSELAKLWSCPEDDLLQYGATGTLKICHLFKQAIADWKRKVCTDNGFTTNDLDQNVLIKEGIVGLGNPGNIYRIGRSDLLSLLRGETIKPWAIYPAIENTDGQLTFGIIKKRCQFGIVGGHLFPGATDEEPLVDTLKIQCLIVTQEEVNRFEQDHGISQLGMITEKPKPHEPETNTKKTKLDKQITAILDAAKCKKYDPLKIPDGGKTEIQAIVSTDPETQSLFSKYSAFETAWRRARTRELVKMENHDSYAKSNR